MAAACPAHPLQVFFPTEERSEWGTRLVGPALVSPRPGAIAYNNDLHREIWGVDHLRANGREDAQPPPDDLIKFITAGGRAARQLGSLLRHARALAD